VRRAAKLFLGVAVGILACLSTARAEPPQQRPFIGYLCGAGGQRGTTVQLTVGGQNLRGAKQVVVSGTGVRGKVLRHGRTPWLLQNEQRRLLGQMLRRLAVQKITGKAPRGKLKNVDDQGKPVVLPDHPLLRDLESMTLEELRRVAYEYLDPARRSQISAQIVETALIEVVLDPDAAPGERELRLVTPLGLTNPVLFQVGLLPESKEQEPNDYRTARQPTTTLPRVLNGQVSFKDIDRFRFRARAGQKLVIEAQARRLVPYLADAVPGWFQATLAIYDDRGQEIRYVDDFRFDPDPVCLFEVPRTGEYVLEIRDAIHRGREDFVYRITIAERPYVTSLYPLGGKAGAAVTAEVGGWNLPWDHVILDTTPGSRTRASSWSAGGMLTNPVTYAVDDLPDSLEKEPNDGPREGAADRLPPHRERSHRGRSATSMSSGSRAAPGRRSSRRSGPAASARRSTPPCSFSTPGARSWPGTTTTRTGAPAWSRTRETATSSRRSRGTASTWSGSRTPRARAARRSPTVSAWVRRSRTSRCS
jgi:hypothetical protein